MTRSELKINAVLGLLIFSFVAIAIFVSLPMILNDYPIGHSTKFNLSWAFQYQRQFFGGQFYPRWLEFSNYGFGNPTFVFYPPFCMVATLPFKALGFNLPTSLIASMGLATLVLGWGTYRYSRCFFPIWLSLLVGELTMLSPYLAVDIYHRAAIAEVWGIAFVPWILWATQQLITQAQKRLWILILASTFCLIIISHLPTLVMFTLVWAVYPVFMSQKREILIANLRYCYSAALLSLFCTAFYLVPAVLDQRFIYAEFLTEDPEYRPQNRLMISGILSLHPKLTNHWFEGLMMPIWWGTAAIAVLAIIYIAYSYFKKRTHASEKVEEKHQVNESSNSLNRAQWFWLFSTVLSILMMTDVLAWLYPLSPLILERIQFSWRWFSITTVTAPLLIGYFIWQLKVTLQSQASFAFKFLQTPIILLLLVLIVGELSLSRSLPLKTWFDSAFIERFTGAIEQKQFPKEPNTDGPSKPFFDWHKIYPDGLGLGDVPEYRADVTRDMPIPPPQNQPLVSWDTGTTENINIERWQYGFRQFSVNTPVSDRLLLRMLYYPAWRLEIDGEVVPLQITRLGQMQVLVPAGEHEIIIKYWGTLAEWLGYICSWVTAIAIGLWWWQTSKSQPQLEFPS